MRHSICNHLKRNLNRNGSCHCQSDPPCVLPSCAVCSVLLGDVRCNKMCCACFNLSYHKNRSRSSRYLWLLFTKSANCQSGLCSRPILTNMCKVKFNAKVYQRKPFVILSEARRGSCANAIGARRRKYAKMHCACSLAFRLTDAILISLNYFPMHWKPLESSGSSTF